MQCKAEGWQDKSVKVARWEEGGCNCGSMQVDGERVCGGKQEEWDNRMRF